MHKKNNKKDNNLINIQFQTIATKNYRNNNNGRWIYHFTITHKKLLQLMILKLFLLLLQLCYNFSLILFKSWSTLEIQNN